MNLVTECCLNITSNFFTGTVQRVWLWGFQRCTLRSETIFSYWKPFKNDEKCFYFTSKALFILKVSKSLFWLFGHVAKWLDKKDKVNFKFYDITAWLTNNCNTHIAPIPFIIFLFLVRSMIFVSEDKINKKIDKTWGKLLLL